MATKPTIIPRNYDFSLSGMAALDKSAVTVGVVHHVGNESGSPAADPPAANTNAYHINTKGYAGIGYHFVIRRNGDIEEGRPLDKRGVHTASNNHYTIGILLNGHGDKIDFTEAQMQSLVALAKWLETYFPNLKEWKRHSDIRATSCPGKFFPWDEFLRRLKAGDEVAQLRAEVQRLTAENKTLTEQLNHCHQARSVMAADLKEAGELAARLAAIHGKYK